MEGDFLPKKAEPPGEIVDYKENASKKTKLKENLKNAINRGVKQTPQIIDEAFKSSKDYLQAKGVENENLRADTCKKLTESDLNQTEQYKKIAEIKKLERETESIERQNRMNDLEYESVKNLHESLKKQNIPHYIKDGDIIFINDGDKK